MSDVRPQPEPGDIATEELNPPSQLYRQGMEPDGAERRVQARLDREHDQDERAFRGRIL